MREDAWYLHDGRMPAGIMIESGQADLMLICYLGVDCLNRGERVYRLLGCELTFHGDLPRPGDTLTYDIHVDGHATHGDVRLFFFHYDCHAGDRPQLTVRQGQAGFFTDAELANSDGCLWRPEDQEIVAEPRLDPPLCETGRSFTAAQVRAFAEGRPGTASAPASSAARDPHPHAADPGRADAASSTRSTSFDPRGGPWGRGYLRATTPISPDDWFFDGHFKNDPCMPGTLMFEGCLQAMAFYLTAARLHRRARRLALRAGAGAGDDPELPRPGDPDLEGAGLRGLRRGGPSTGRSRRSTPTCSAPSTGSRRSTPGGSACAWCRTGR